MAHHSKHTYQQRGFSQGAGQGFAGQGTQGTAGVMEQVKDKAQDVAGSVAETAEELWDSTKQGVQQATSTVADQAEDAYLTVTDFMSRYPLATFFAGCGVGILLMMA